MKNIKIICCDIDGTLLRDDKSLSEENRFWISKAVKEKGVKFVIVSGRILSALKHFNSELGISGLSSCLNGTYLVDENDNVLANHTISYEDSLKILDVYEESEAEMIALSGNTWYSETKEGFLYSDKTKLYMQPGFIVKFRDLIETTPINKYAFRAGDQSVIGSMMKKLETSKTLTLYGGRGFLEVMTGGITKGTAVDDLISYYKVDRSQVMSLGDDINDLEMIQKSGLGIAMGNALDCVKKVAADVTDTNQNNGVAKAIRKYVFDNTAQD